MLSALRKTSYSPIGLDLGRQSLRAVQLAHHSRRSEVYAALEIPYFPEPPASSHASDNNAVTPSLTPNPNITDQLTPPTSSPAPPNTTESPNTAPFNPSEHALFRLAKHQAFQGRDVVLHCPSDKLDLRPVQIPCQGNNLPHDAVIGVLRMQAAENLQFSVDQLVFDYFTDRLDTEKALMSIMAVTADGQWIKQQIALVEKAGFHCVGVDALPACMSRLLLSSLTQPNSLTPTDDQPGEKVNVLIDIGYQASTLIVANQRGPIFCRRFNFGGEQATRLIANKMHLTKPQAERMKIIHGMDHPLLSSTAKTPPVPVHHEYGAPVQHAILPTQTAQSTITVNPIANAIYSALRNDLHEFMEGLTRALNYIINDYRGAFLQHIVLTGAASHLQKCDMLLSDHFEMPVQRLSHPLLNEITQALPDAHAESGRWTTALSLALPKGATL